MYIDNQSLDKISKKVGVTITAVKKWKSKYKWIEIREKAIQKVTEMLPSKYSKIIDDQIEITNLAAQKLLSRLKTPGTWHNKDLIQIVKHGLELVRPKVNPEFNFIKQDINQATLYKFEIEDVKDKTIKKAT